MKPYMMNLRRVRKSEHLRDLFSTVSLSSEQLILPLFVNEKLSTPTPIQSLEGQFTYDSENILKEIENCLEKNLKSFLLFIVPKEKKDSHFSYDFDLTLIKRIKETFGHHLNLITDMCLCGNTKSGHCGIIKESTTKNKFIIDNQESVEALTEKALLYAQAGADVIAPSDMMDNRIQSIRKGLDETGLSSTLIMSYSTKFSSAFYGPFREAAESTPQAGDRKSYQISPNNWKDALNSSLRDWEQGADILMVKPAGAYLDIINQIKNHPSTQTAPLAAYQVSGEYQALKLMANHHLLNFNDGLWESLMAIKRAGADMIITYGAKEWTDYL